MRIIAAFFLLGMGLASADGQDLQQIARIAIPGNPINQFGALTIDPASGLGYFAEKDNKGIVVFDTRTNAFVKRLTGFGGRNAKGELAGPNGVIAVNNGAQLWVSEGDSSVRIVDLAKGAVTATLVTGGVERANAMGYDSIHGVVLVANSNEPTPFLSLISTQPDHAIIAKIPVPQSAENIERSVFHAASGMFYTAIPVLSQDKSKGILAQTDAQSGRLVALHELDGCHPHSLQIVADATIFLGCSNGHGPTPKPGGDLAVFDMGAGRIIARRDGLGGNGGSDINPKLARYYHATTNATMVVIDTRTGQLVQKLATPPGARSLAVDLATNRVYLATTAKDGPCGGCILVFEQP